MKGRTVFGALALLAVASGALAFEERWLHVFIDDRGSGGEKVRVNVPFELLEAIVQELDMERLSGGKIRLDREDMDADEIRAILRAVRGAREGEYVTVEGVDEDVRVRKAGDLLHIRVHEGKKEGAAPENVEIRVHLSVLDALAAGEGDEIDILAAIHALGEHGEGELVTVEEESATIRVWVDKQAGTEEP